jgi:ribonuclease Z
MLQQIVDPNSSRDLMKVLLLGTGTPAPSLRRQSSGYLFNTGSNVIVIDHGPGASFR